MDGKKSKKKAGNDVFASCSFSSLGLHPTLCQLLEERMEFDAPTQVQAQAIPVILSGRHMLVSAITGSGKTVTYLAPIIHQLQKYDPKIQRWHFCSVWRVGNMSMLLEVKGGWVEEDILELVCNYVGASTIICKSKNGWPWSKGLVTDGPHSRHELFGKLILKEAERGKDIAVYEILEKLLHRFHWIVPGHVMGGASRSKEKARLRKGISILVGTPGRLLDHLKNTSSFLHMNLRWIVFDEADSILEQGFGKAIEEMLDILGSRQNMPGSKENTTSGVPGVERQNILLSATLNEKVNYLAKISLENPVTIGLDEKKVQPNSPIGQVRSLESGAGDILEHSGKVLSISSNEEYKVPTQLVQRYVKVPCGIRIVVLLSILKNLFAGEPSQKIVVFFSTCDAVDFHYSLLREFQWPPSSQSDAESRQLFLGCNILRLHGNLKHEDRITIFKTFKTEKSAVLLSTDVSARGLDFPKVRCIIQYDSPGEATEYVHRVGRTARLGERGDSLLFLQPAEIDYLQDLKKHGVSITEYSLPKLLDSFPLYGLKHHVKKFVSIEMHPWVLSLQKSLESFILTEPSLKKLAQRAFCSWIRAYGAHRGELKSIFMVKKLHLGHVARSFALKDQPSLVVKSVQKQADKRKRDQRQKGVSKKRKLAKRV